MVRIYTVKLNQIFSKQKGVVMAKHYKDIGKPEGYDSKMELVGLLKQLKEYQHLEEQGRLVKLPCKYVYYIVDINNPKYAMVMKRPIRELAIYEIEDIDKENCKYFSTEEKAEAKLKELRGRE